MKQGKNARITVTCEIRLRVGIRVGDIGKCATKRIVYTRVNDVRKSFNLVDVRVRREFARWSLTWQKLSAPLYTLECSVNFLQV